MSGPRVTAPAAKIARSISTSAVASVPKTNTGTLLTSSKASAPLSRKYADLLKERNIEWDSHSRHIMTRSSNRPHPPQKNMRLMQTFTTSAPKAASVTMDSMTVPEASAVESRLDDPFARIRVPLLPDNFITSHAPEATDAPSVTAEIHVVAANPETVAPAALTEVEGMNIDGVELKFVHEAEAEQPSMMNHMWSGLVDNVLGSKGGPRLAV